MSDAQTSKVKLDWSRLLGFDQAPPADIEAVRLVRIGSKLGQKSGLRAPV